MLSPKVLDFIDGDETSWEDGPLNKLVSQNELMAYRHEGFWQAMDTLREKKLLEEIILIKIPNQIYPEIRSLFILLFEKSGFNKIKIEEKIDFKALYLKKNIY